MFIHSPKSSSAIVHTSNNELNPYILEWLGKLGFSVSDFSALTSWDLKSLPDFKRLKDMDKAVDRIISAVQNKESIAVFGDYDVDGTTSCALLFRFFKKLGVTIKIYQPSRFIEGYGLHPVSVDQAHTDGIKLLITVDCGTTSILAAERAKACGIDLIITDHHKDAAPHWPDCFALINPNRRDEPTNPMQALAGVGVGFALSVCIREKLLQNHQQVESLYDLLPYVAIGTISDLASLNSMNLILCRHGFKALLQSKDLGLRKFLEKKELSLEYIDSEVISFFIGPMINSKGRLDHPEIALEILTQDSQEKINLHFEILTQTNNHRKKIQNEVFDEAKKDILEQMHHHEKISSLIVYRPHWHEGVIGIVASKLVEEFKRPALVFTNADHEGHLKASVRTALSIDIFEQLKVHEHFFTKFGGHKAAAGLTLHKDRFQDFKKSFLSHMDKMINQISFLESLESLNYPLVEIDFSEINGQLIKDIYQLAPFGMNHPMPKWKIRGAKLQQYDILKDHHVKWSFVAKNSQGNSAPKFQKSLNGISFNYLKKHSLNEIQDIINSTNNFSIHAWIKINSFKGNHYIQLVVDQLELH
jgi:single-stranded-DNA-specific exonuclease